jgi:hypothetical protein
MASLRFLSSTIPIGPTGSQGIQGPTGAQGSTGPQGIPGPIGGTDTQILFNQSSSVAGSNDLTFDYNTSTFNTVNAFSTSYFVFSISNYHNLKFLPDSHKVVAKGILL